MNTVDVIIHEQLYENAPMYFVGSKKEKNSGGKHMGNMLLKAADRYN